ncbi:hypothetical protein DICSQDRAFT_127289 [Dichomitus squalens LYAD-421 SS1]|uniref:Uncharacterized protein n=1 Tax=Dichomitus squalens (strain LYAD-421) TaxID=732165 RepID=R7T278_DICSQ|nr:uncharacterized protein DICSQDRAFT_127289 [Dichomitus squalens LYAD-421 SS1]EJF61302.1 hypothetical protein DICSQDRAFT_127289 [Dichomitus squalens LYAD-421 SS1]
MASAASPSTPSGGVNSSMWANQPPSRQGWGRNGESGPAFRGASRAKDTSQNAPPLAPAASSTPAPPSGTPSPALSKASSQSKDTHPRPRKTSEAKPPRKVVPPIVVEPPPIAASNSPISATTPIRSRRKRSQNRSMSNSSSKKSLSTESSTSHLRAEKSPTITKDLPPHLAPVPPETPSFDIKHDINALVERVRAVAMERPNTPGSHIDWAGEDDDSLPDLDDWGVKSVTDKSTSSSIPEQPEKPDLLSPMLADALRPLPSVEVGTPLAVSAAPTAEKAPAPAQPLTSGEVGNNTPRGPTSLKAHSDKFVVDRAPLAGLKKQTERKKADAHAKSPEQSASVPKPAAEQATAPKQPSPKQANHPLHPSLPPKPIEAIDALTKRVPRKPAPVQTPDPAADYDVPLKSGLSESMHAPKPNSSISPESSGDSPSPEPQGVPASKPAPVHSAPSYITTHSTPSFQPGHGRAHTIGRPRDLRMPHGASPAAFDGHPDERPGTSTAHSRTVHASRPVITVAALSGLARALGGTPPKREAASVAAALKD